ncbi:MAG TPA: hypothetical protein VMN04_00905, partial [Thermoanaerobaculia bacterium]|nr:hypothetical protein [Thermoanaerobaculia bacterium]
MEAGGQRETTAEIGGVNGESRRSREERLRQRRFFQKAARLDQDRHPRGPELAKTAAREGQELAGGGEVRRDDLAEDRGSSAG